MHAVRLFWRILAGTLKVPLQHWLATAVFLISVGLPFALVLYVIGKIGSNVDYQTAQFLRRLWISLALLPEIFKPILIAPALYVWCRYVVADLPRTEFVPHSLRAFARFMVRFFSLWILLCILFAGLHIIGQDLLPRASALPELIWSALTLALGACIAAQLAAYLMPGAFVVNPLSWRETATGTLPIRLPLISVGAIFAVIALVIVMALENLTVSEAYYGPIIQTAMELNIVPEIFFGLVNSYIYFMVYCAAGAIWWVSIGLTVYQDIKRQRDLRESEVFT